VRVLHAHGNATPRIHVSVQQKAEPGEILTTGDVRNLFATQSAAQFTRYGGTQLDKMARQVDLFALARPGSKAKRTWVQRMRQNNWRMVQAGLAAAVAVAMVAGAALVFRQAAPDGVAGLTQPGGQPVVAVTPFDNISGDETLNYFSTGMTEEIQHAVSRIKGIRVVMRGTGAKGGEAKGTTHLLSGSVKKNGDRVRVSAQLARTDGEILWSDSFERPIAETVVVQDEIARKVAQALSVVAPESAKSATIDPRAFELYLRGRDLWRTGGEGLGAVPKSAISNLEEAVRIAPNFARAWVALASAYAQRQNWSVGDEQAALIEKARDAASKALEIDPTLGEAYIVLGRFSPSSDWAERGALFAKALAAEPNDGDVLMLHANFWLAEIGQWQEASRQLTRAYEIDPSSRLLVNRYSEALIATGDKLGLEKLIVEREAGDPVAGVLWQPMMVDSLRKGDFDGARTYKAKLFAAYDRLAKDFPNSPINEAKAQIDGIFDALETRDPVKISAIVAKSMEDLSKGQAAAAQTVFDFALMGQTELLKDVLEKLYLQDGYKAGPPEGQGIVPTAYPNGRVPMSYLTNAFFSDLWKDPLFWKIFAAKGLAKYWRDSGQWPDFCAQIGGIAACRDLADKALAAQQVN